jgi:Phage portal protein
LAFTDVMPRRSALVERVAAERAASRRVIEGRVVQAPVPADPKVPERAGYVTGIPRGGLNEYTSALGTSTQTDRRSLLQELYEAYLACPWAWASVNAISRTITAGGLVMDWDRDDGEGDQEQPDKPPEVLALERLIGFCNPVNDIRQLLRNVIADLEVFGDAYIEVSWVGKIPVALYNLDCPTTTPITDEHGQITGFKQTTEYGQTASFDPHEVIHIALDAPRSGVFGVSPTQGALLPITAWLFAASTGKEMFRKGLPINIHVDFPAGTSDTDIRRWTAQYMARNIGPRNIGQPITTKNGGKIVELQFGKVADVLSFKSQCRDEILSEYGCPPAKAGVIESGNLGGGTGEDQNKTFLINTCQPIAEIVLEKLNFALAKHGFNITGWHMKFKEIDYRDSVIIEGIRDSRLRNGSWTLNRYRAEIGEPPVDGGDDAVLVDRQNLVLWSDMKAMSTAMVASKGTAPAIGAPPAAGELPAAPGEEPPPDGKDDDTGPEDGPPKPGENWPGRYGEYRKRLAEALRVLPGGDRAA